ncbi:hypothetical protein [Pseudonocardia endophytica]|uniref:Uncharacterized protein n=1 Tax=Pseudonocardia endophytica TaxID=401976 RepID=A0A4R1I0U4_PSEEN|nr:hypothetical protein [Pseudonocardia endophytica]TCK27521.1 hypothetical protein EV378_3393 [Pseudonocardia endophytica]
MGISFVDAVRLSRSNRAQHEQIRERHAALSERVEDEHAAQEQCRREVYDTALVPFRDTFARLKNIELAELAAIVAPDSAELPDVELPTVRPKAVGGIAATAGGVTVGAGAGTAAFTGVGAFAAASTGTPIASLSGAAATNATLAWLGGGSLAAGGGGVAAGTLVLTGVVGLPILLAGGGYLVWEGRRTLRRQKATATTLTEIDAELAHDELCWAGMIERMREMRTVLGDLGERIRTRLEPFVGLVDRNADYDTSSPGEKASVATLVRLATTTVTVMSTPHADEDRVVTDRSADVVRDARVLLADLDEKWAA